MMYCSRCGLQMLASAHFCGNCGLAASPVAFTRSGAAMAMSMSEGTGFGSSAAAPPPPPAASAPPPVANGPAPGLIARIRNMLLSPKSEWPIIAPETTTVGQLFAGYVIPLTVLVAVMSFVRMSVIGVSLPFGGTIRSPMSAGLQGVVMTLIFGAVGVFVVAFIINTLAPTFGGQKDQRQALKVAAYSLTPAYVGSVFGLLPSFSTLLQFIAGIYGIYLLYLGLPAVMRSDRNRAGGYTASVVVCTILLSIVIGVVMTALGIHRAGAFGSPMSEEMRRQQGADAVASVLGGALGTDAQGKAGISAAISNLAKSGEQMEQQEKARDAAAARASSSSADNASRSAASSAAAAAAGDRAGVAGTADPAANPAAAAAGLLTALGGALGGDKRVEPVDFHALESILPGSLPGMTRTNAQGAAQQALGVKSSSATGNYRGDGSARVEIKISDASGVSGLMDLASQFGMSDTSESDSGFEKNVSIGGREVHEKYDRSAKHGELNVIVGKRYAVDVTGDSIDMATLEKDLSMVDLGKLESMKDAGAK